MVGLRETLAVVLGVALGALLLVYPHVFIRIQTLGHLPRDRHGRYGEDSPEHSSGWVHLVRLLGVGCLLAAGYVAIQVL